MLFLTLSAHAEAVTWVVGRTDLLATFFYLAAFSAYLAYREAGLNDPKKPGRAVWFGLSLLLFCFCLLSKELAVTLPILILLYEIFLWKGRHQARLDLSVIPFFVIVVLYAVFRHSMIGHWVGGYEAIKVSSWQVLSSLFFLTIAFLPPIVPMKLLPALLVVILAGCLWYRHRKGYSLQPILGFCLIAVLLTFLPVLPLMEGLPLNGINGRLIYVGSTFSCLLTALVGDLLLPSAGAFLAATALLAALNGVFLVRANLRWWNAGALCRQLIADAGPVLPVQRLYVLNIPSNLNDPFVLNNGFPDGLDMQYSAPVKKVFILSYMRLTSTTAPVILRRSGSSFYLLQIPPNPQNPILFLGSRFDANSVDQGDGFYAVWSKATDSVSVHLTGLSPGDRVLYYSAGHFLPVPTQKIDTPSPQ